MADKIVFLNDLIIRRNEDNILHNLFFELKSSEFCYLIGRTGSGKSSLLKALYGAIPIHSGKAMVCGFDLNKLRKGQKAHLRRKIGMIFQDFRLFEEWSVRQNLDFVLKVTTRKSKKERLNRIIEVLSDVGLADKLHQRVSYLSGGEKQRLAIGRALLNQPKLLIADEPTGNLDPETSDEIIYLLSNINKQKHTAILLATHDYRLIEKFPNRIIQCADKTIKNIDYVR